MARTKAFDGNFQMTEFEIIKDYGEALDKSEQIKILADLNLCRREDIIAVLKKNGIPVPEVIGRKPYNRTKETKQSSAYDKKSKEDRRKKYSRGNYGVIWNEENLSRLGELVREGLSLSQITERFGTGPSAISKQICKHGLRGGL